MTAQEKAAEVLDTPTAAAEVSCTPILGFDSEVSKTYSELKTELGRFGYTLTRAYRMGDGRITYIAARLEQARTFTRLHDLHAFLAQTVEAQSWLAR